MWNETKLTLYDSVDVVRPVLEGNHVFSDLGALLKFLPQQVDLVVDKD